MVDDLSAFIQALNRLLELEDVLPQRCPRAVAVIVGHAAEVSGQDVPHRPNVLQLLRELAKRILLLLLLLVFPLLVLDHVLEVLAAVKLAVSVLVVRPDVLLDVIHLNAALILRDVRHCRLASPVVRAEHARAFRVVGEGSQPEDAVVASLPPHSKVRLVPPPDEVLVLAHGAGGEHHRRAPHVLVCALERNRASDVPVAQVLAAATHANLLAHLRAEVQTEAHADVARPVALCASHGNRAALAHPL